MRRREFNPKDDMKTIIEEFKDFKELLDVCDSRDLVWSRATRNITGRARFHGCDSFEEARDMFLHGCNEGVDRMVKSVNALKKSGSKKQTVRYADVCGYAPIVPAAINGLPCSMINQKKVMVKSRVITIVFETGVAANVTPQQVRDYGVKVINLVMDLEQAGYRVKLDVAQAYTGAVSGRSKGRQYICRVPVKNENQPVNVKRIAFALAHVAMLRYIFFDWVERLPKSKEIPGYGSTLYGYCPARTNFEKHLDENEHLVYYGMDLEKEFRG